MYDDGPLLDIVTLLLLAMSDPSDQGAPPRSPLQVAIRRDESHLWWKVQSCVTERIAPSDGHSFTQTAIRGI